MTKIKPFNAVIYNQEQISNLVTVVCPPYDVISPQEQERYQALNPYNLIHVLLGKDIPGAEDKYRRAENYFKEWFKNKILVRDEKPAVYFYSQQYTIKGERKIRFGFIGLLHLGDKGGPAAFCHEHTRVEPKEDRLKLLKRVKANLSPIFVIFADKKRLIQRVLLKYIDEKKPFVDITDTEKINHKLWRIDSPEILEKIQSQMKNEDIFIADGHHRYEVACAYRDEMMKKTEQVTGDEDFNYIMAYFTNLDPRGLTILPIHRLVNTGTPIDVKGLLAKIKEDFDIIDIKDKQKFFFLMESAGKTEHALGMYADKRYWLLRLKNIKLLNKLTGNIPAEIKSLDVTILNHIILKNIMGLDIDDKINITFSPHPEELISSVDKNKGALAFFLNPVKAEQIIAVALKNEKMPTKSTYFYPKVLSGLVINKHGAA